jgi:hypothetical protein
MKVSRREFVALSILLIVGILYILYTFLFSPLFDNIAVAKDELAAQEARLASYHQIVDNNDLAKLEAEQQARIQAIEEKASPFLAHINQSEILAFIDNLAKGQNISLYAVAFQEEELFDTTPAAADAETGAYPLSSTATEFKTTYATVPADMGPDAAQTPAPAAADSGSTAESTAIIRRINVEIQFYGASYAQILGFIKDLESNGRAIYLQNADITTTLQVDTGLAATLVYSFDQADKLTDSNDALATVVPADNVGKTDPFTN